MIFLILVFAVLASGADNDASLAISRHDGIIKVQPECSPSEDGLSTISVFADYPVVVEIYCKNDVVVRPLTSDGVKYSQSASFTSQDGVPCVFEKKVKSSVYTVKVRVGWKSRDGKSAVVQAREYFLVTCTYDEQSENSTKRDKIDADKEIFNEIAVLKGNVMKDTTISMTLVDVTGQPVGDEEVPLGRLIQLQAVVNGSRHVRPLSCAAVNGDNMYRILLGGCGDGLMIPKTSGFTVTGNRIISPFFVAFHLEGSNSLVFKCNFTACWDDATCDGSSCYKEDRSKGAVGLDPVRPDVAVVATGNPVSVGYQSRGILPLLLSKSAAMDSQTFRHFHSRLPCRRGTN